MRLTSVLLIIASTHFGVEASFAEEVVTSGRCSPIVIDAGNVRIECSGVPEEALKPLIAEITAQRLALGEANDRAEKWAEHYFEVVSKYSTIAAFMTDEEREQAASLITQGNIDGAEIDLMDLKIRIDAIKENTRNEMVQTMQQIVELGLNPGGVVADRFKWQPGRELKVCFFDGSQEARKRVADIANNWTLYGNISFDFGYSLSGFPQICDSNNSYEIRVSLEPNPPRNSSYIGRTSLQKSQGESTIQLANHQERVVLHEFGHALGLHHIFFHPDSCVQDIDFAAAVDYFGSRFGWSERHVRLNLRTLPGDAEGYSMLGFDSSSIMSFKLPDEIFESPEDNCTKNVDSLSLQDKLAIFQTYPI